MRSASLVIGVICALALSACGGGASAQARITGCEKIFLHGVAGNDPTMATDPEAKRGAALLCKEAQAEGILNDKGDATKSDIATLMRKQPQVLVPTCEVGFRHGIGSNAAAVEKYLPPGGLTALATEYCSDLGPYVQGTGLDQAALFKDRGRLVVVPICIATAQAGVAANPQYPFSAADSLKIFTRVCAQAWDNGLVSESGGTNTAAVQALAAKTVRQMVRAGQITVIKHG